MPDSLEIPIDVTVERATVERLEWRYGNDQGALDDIRLSYAGDRRTHRVQDLDVRGAGGRLAGSASVGTTQPFPTRASLTLDLVKPHPEGRVQAQIDGTFAVLSVVAKSTLAGVAADAQAKLAPFAAPAVPRRQRSTRRTSISRASNADWPTTRLAVVVGREAFAWRIHRARATRQRHARPGRCESHSDRADQRNVHAVRRNARVARHRGAGRGRNGDRQRAR